MATVETSHGTHSPPPPGAQRPKGILKNSFQRSPPVSPTTNEKDLTDKELTIQNTHQNAGHRRSSSTASRPAGSRRQSSRTPSAADDAEYQQRLKWDEANLYLTEQERSSTMKIDEPKTPWAKQYEPSEADDEEMTGDDREDIPGLSLGEPEEEVPVDEFAPRKSSKVHVSDSDATPQHDAENEYFGMNSEEREKHRRFEELRKKHYEMREAVGLLGHPEDLDDADEDDDEDEGGKSGKAPPVPKLPATVNGTS